MPRPPFACGVATPATGSLRRRQARGIIIGAMPVVYGSPDLLPTLSVVYACRCGLRITETGTHAGEPPPKWLRVDEGEYLCEHCAAQARRTAQKSVPTSSR